jgi:hypothetical protein
MIMRLKSSVDERKAHDKEKKVINPQDTKTITLIKPNA